MRLSETAIQRYARHIILPEIGGEGQKRLSEASIFVVGAGGLGSPVLLYLAAAGIGRLGIIDDDTISLSNLQRQIIHSTSSIGQQKTESVRERLKEINPLIQVESYTERLSEENGGEYIKEYDVVVDGSDNFTTRYLVNDRCLELRKPLITASLYRFEGQITTIKGYLGVGHPCYRCIFADKPPVGLVPSCAQTGVLGAVAGVVGSLQATEAIKEVLGIGESLSGSLLIYQSLETKFYKIKVEKSPDCRVCNTYTSSV